MNIVILGAGITGLTLAYKLQQRYVQKIQLSIFERADRPGGWIQTLEKDGFLFELGPRSCRPHGNGAATLSLIQHLGLQNEVIHASPAGRKRYILEGGKLQKLSPFSLLRRLAIPLCKEMWRPCSLEEDESIEQFFLRRLGAEITYGLIDPLVSGIYAGNISDLSIKFCFSRWHQWEKEKGSLLKGAFSHRSIKSENPFIKEMQRRGIFTLKRGMESLIHSLAYHLKRDLRLGENVVKLIPEDKKIRVLTSRGEDILADHVFSTLPQGGADLILDDMPESWKILRASVVVVSLGYRSHVLQQQGFGYLVPTREKQNILGVVWDSSAFPTQNRHENETRLTVMLGGQYAFETEENILKVALKNVYNHMGIEPKPDVFHIHRAINSIPQYYVGHQKKIHQMHRAVVQKTKSLTMLGTSFNGVAVNDAIAAAMNMSEIFNH